jgi:kinesin family protein 18/19
VREDQERGIVVVAGVAERPATSADEVLAFLSEGNANRKTEATMANQVSSRSHAVLQVTLRHSRKSSSGRQVHVESKLSLIDLAGSERASATNNRGARLQEGANINKSLLALANCINALAASTTSGKKQNVKYRDSKLTHLLKSSLEGHCNLIMIANINPSHFTYEDSHNTLKYANRAKNIKVNPTAVEVTREGNWMEREETLRKENAYLRAKVAALEKEVRILKSGRPSLLVERDEAILEDGLLYAEDSMRDSISGFIDTDSIEIVDLESDGNISKIRLLFQIKLFYFHK